MSPFWEKLTIVCLFRSELCPVSDIKCSPIALSLADETNALSALGGPLLLNGAIKELD